MNINRIGQNSTLVGNIPKPAKTDMSFRDMLSRTTEEATKANTTEALPVPQNKPLNFGSKKFDYIELNNPQFKTFVSESMQFSVSEIKKEIDEICDDTTGENIDMDALNECLDMYIEEKDKRTIGRAYNVFNSK